MPTYNEKTGIVSGVLGEEIDGPCEVCNGYDDISFHAGIACRKMFGQPTIVICKSCWDKEFKKHYPDFVRNSASKVIK